MRADIRAPRVVIVDGASFQGAVDTRPGRRSAPPDLRSLADAARDVAWSTFLSRRSHPTPTFRLREPGDVSELAVAIGRLGQLDAGGPAPAPARRDGEGKRWQVVAGFRRMEALRLLQRERVLARVHPSLADDDAWALALAGPLFGEPWSPADLDAVAGQVRARLPWAEPALAARRRAAPQGARRRAAAPTPQPPRQPAPAPPPTRPPSPTAGRPRLRAERRAGRRLRGLGRAPARGATPRARAAPLPGPPPPAPREGDNDEPRRRPRPPARAPARALLRAAQGDPRLRARRATSTSTASGPPSPPRGTCWWGGCSSTASASVQPLVRGVGGLTLGADPLASAVAFASFLAGEPVDAFIVRKEPKGHGTGQWIEGRKTIPDGSRVAVLEDVITTGGSAAQGHRALPRRGAGGGGLLRAGRPAWRAGARPSRPLGVPVDALFTRTRFSGIVPAMKRFLLLALLLSALRTTSRRPPTPSTREGAWAEVRDGATRTAKLYDVLDDVAFATATWQSPAVAGRAGRAAGRVEGDARRPRRRRCSPGSGPRRPRGRSSCWPSSPTTGGPTTSPPTRAPGGSRSW